MGILFGTGEYLIQIKKQSSANGLWLTAMSDVTL